MLTASQKAICALRGARYRRTRETGMVQSKTVEPHTFVWLTFRLFGNFNMLVRSG